MKIFLILLGISYQTYTKVKGTIIFVLIISSGVWFRYLLLCWSCLGSWYFLVFLFFRFDFVVFLVGTGGSTSSFLLLLVRIFFLRWKGSIRLSYAKNQPCLISVQIIYHKDMVLNLGVASSCTCLSYGKLRQCYLGNHNYPW